MTAPAHRLPALEPGAFALAAHEAAAYGLSVIPVRDKEPLVGGFTKRRYPPNAETIAKWAGQWPDADLAIPTGAPSGVAVVDLDTRDQLDLALEHFGETPIRVLTRRGHHLYYRWSDERRGKLPAPFKGDLVAAGSIVVIPPSANKSFLLGSWADLPDLPRLPETDRAAPGSSTTALEPGRNEALFRHCMHQVRSCDSEAALLDVAQTFGAACEPPLPEAEVERTALKAWDYEARGKNWIGHPPACGQVRIAEDLMDVLLRAHRRRGTDAVVLYMKLLAKHAARHRRGESFPVVARAMARDAVLPWPERRIRDALHILLGIGLVVMVKEGGHGPADAHLYRFRAAAPA